MPVSFSPETDMPVLFSLLNKRHVFIWFVVSKTAIVLTGSNFKLLNQLVILITLR